MFSVCSTFTLQKKILGQFGGYPEKEHVNTHLLGPTPAFQDLQNDEFFTFEHEKTISFLFSILDVYPSYFDPFPNVFRPKYSKFQRASFVFLIHLLLLFEPTRKIKKTHIWIFRPPAGHLGRLILIFLKEKGLLCLGKSIYLNISKLVTLYHH